MSQEEPESISQEELRDRQAELAVLEKLAARGWEVDDPTISTARNFVRLLDLPDQQGQHTQALQRLIRRKVLVVVPPETAKKYALVPLGRLGENELLRLRALYADPKARLQALHNELSRELALAGGQVADLEPHIRRARELLAEMQPVINRL